jgi:nitrite reductase/ring-hydroxylating ferredoxin subunit
MTNAVMTGGCVMAVSRYCAFMDWQQIVSLGIVASTAAWVVTRLFRRRHESTFGHCACPSGGASSGSQNSIIFRARKGERPEVVVKFR